jgi:adenylosuccinate lyase
LQLNFLAMSHLTELNAVSPIDGRYSRHTKNLRNYFSEQALIRYRVLIEIEYFIALVEWPISPLSSFDKGLFTELRKIYTDFSEDDALKIKAAERITNHDVKAVEYFIKDEFDRLNIAEYKEFIHFGLTSQDINNTATPLLLKEGIEAIYIPLLEEIITVLSSRTEDWKTIPMLARTHGQAASPTLLGKEIMVFVERLNVQLEQLKKIPYSAKFGGATGNFNAHSIAFPEVDWIGFSNKFVDGQLGLSRSQFTTQIEHYDNLAAIFDNLKRINSIIIDLDRDIWTYVSMDYFKQKIKDGEVGSSAMPHKVNPIDFENSEGNLGLANALFEHLSAKLPISRLQRDLTDSTVLRNIGVPLGHTLIAFRSLLKGMDKLIINEEKFLADLDNNWAVLAEAIQTVLRGIGYPNPYEALKELTRTNKKMTKESLAEFIDGLDIDKEIKTRLKDLSPEKYTGINLY